MQQIHRNIELVRYRKYGDELLLFELVNTVSVAPSEAPAASPSSEASSTGGFGQRMTAAEQVAGASPDLRDLFEATKAYLLSLGDDVQLKPMKYYFAFKRLKNFACVELYRKAKVLTVHVKVDPQSIKLEDGFTRDVREVGHFGTGDLEISIRSTDDFEQAKSLLLKSYEAS